MIAQDFIKLQRLRPVAIKMLLSGLAGCAVLGLQACVMADMPQPKYPIYMQDKPVEAAAVDTQPVEQLPPVIGTPSPSGSVQVTDLAPPPLPPVKTTPPVKSTATTVPVKNSLAAYVYVMQPKDTLYGVSRRFGVSVKDMNALNDLTPESSLRIGQKILLPTGAVDKGVEEHANGTGLVKVAAALPPKPKVSAPVTSGSQVSVPANTTPKVVEAKPSATSVIPNVAAKPDVKPATTIKPTAVIAGFPSNAQISQMGKGMFVWPLKGRLLVPFGQLAPNVRNDGLNIGASSGTEVKAASDGVVVYEGDQVKELGNTIYIKHANGWYTGYSHLGGMKVKNNETVTKGQVIGMVGQTGVIDQPQLHFEIRYTPSTDIARPIDPALVLP